jgi:DNA-binding response OmpR family regulator
MPHVLVVDDYPGICPVLQAALQELSECRITGAVTGDEAATVLRCDRPDLVVLDALLPGISGIELAADASQRGIPVILMTGDAEASEGLVASGWRHLQKPFRVETLIAEVREVLARAEENLAMVRASLHRLRETQAAHQQAFEKLRATLLRSIADREGRGGGPGA